MKTKTILIMVLAGVIGGSLLWLAPRRLWAADTTSASRTIHHYACPMHPSIQADKPVKCSICGMTLQPVYEKTKGTNAPPAAVSTNKPAAMMPGCCAPGACR